MKATVIVKFQDKNTREHHFIGDVLEVDKNRLEELLKAGVVKEDEAEMEEYVAEPLNRKRKR